MAEINQEPTSTRSKPKKHSTKLDMTPMVDLAFLLLTFFILTTVFHKERILPVHMPADGTDGKVHEDVSVTILAGKSNKLAYYRGKFVNNDVSRLHRTNYSSNGLRADLRDMNKTLIHKISEIEFMLSSHKINEAQYRKMITDAKKNFSNKGIIVTIKITDDASYNNLVDILDEMDICNVVNYAIADITKEEEELLASL